MENVQAARPQNLFITGATGFVGSALLRRLSRDKARVAAAVLVGEDAGHLPAEVTRVAVEPLSGSSDYSAALKGVDTVIHLAARVHVMQETAADPLQEFRKVNRYGTERLARQAAENGVKRFVFMSTIGINGNCSGNTPFTETDDPKPHNSYSVSKLEAEIALREIGKATGMEVVIVRAPLVYGPGNPGNFIALLRFVATGLPLPFASVHNLKSFLFVENLADALAACALRQNAAGQTYFVADGEDVSTPQLIRLVASGLGVPARILPFPASLMRFAGGVLGKANAVEQLMGSLQVDCSKIRKDLAWIPPFSLAQGLDATARWFKEQRRG